jgi:hypothetical protein
MVLFYLKYKYDLYYLLTLSILHSKQNSIRMKSDARFISYLHQYPVKAAPQMILL